METHFLPARDIVAANIAAQRELLVCITLALIVIIAACGLAGAFLVSDRVNQAYSEA